MKGQRYRMKKGFTLIEVCLVMLIFGVAVTSLMALFPVSLRQANLAVSDSVVTTFADYVMNALAANAAGEMKGDWDVWKDQDIFEDEILADIYLDTGGGPGTGQGLAKSGKVDGYLGTPTSFIRYKLDFAQEDRPHDYAGRLYRVTLRVTDNKVVPVSAGAAFVT